MSATMHAYNLFRRKDPSGFFCAVPDDHVVPAFVSGSAWEFARKVENSSALPFGFNRKAATMAVRFNGFYLYQTPPR